MSVLLQECDEAESAAARALLTQIEAREPHDPLWVTMLTVLIVIAVGLAWFSLLAWLGVL